MRRTRASTTLARDAMKYFEGTRPAEICATCRQAFEARPGVRLCRSCLEVAWAVTEAIHEEEAREESSSDQPAVAGGPGAGVPGPDAPGNT